MRDELLFTTDAMIDLDHNATTRPAPEVIEVMMSVMHQAYGNPGSRHRIGRRARQQLEHAREQIAGILGAHPDEVIFTSGGTESVNLALRGLIRGTSGAIALPEGEHAATEQTVRSLQQTGWTRRTIPLDSSGRIQPDRLDWDDVKLVTVHLAHSETGVVQEIQPLAASCCERKIPLHVDAVQAVGKLNVDFAQLGCTALSLAAHKFHGPRGIGALLVRRGVVISPLIHGGHQEADKRPGTEAVALAVGMARALELWKEQADWRRTHVERLRNRLEERLVAECQPVVVHAAAALRLPNTLSIGFPGCDAEALLVALDLEGVACSTGTACSSGSAEPSRVLLAMGCATGLARSSLRLSVGMDNTESEIERAADIIRTVVQRVRGNRHQVQ